MQRKRFDLRELGINPKGKVLIDLDVGGLITHAIRKGDGELSRRGTLVIRTKEDHPKYGQGRHTGRSPKDRFLVDHPEIHDHIDWSVIDIQSNRPINQPIEPTLESIQRSSFFLRRMPMVSFPQFPG